MTDREREAAFLALERMAGISKREGGKSHAGVAMERWVASHALTMDAYKADYTASTTSSVS